MSNITKAQGGLKMRVQSTKTNKYGIDKTRFKSADNNYVVKAKTTPTESGSLTTGKVKRTVKGLLTGAKRPPAKRVSLTQDKKGDVTRSAIFRSGGKQMMKRADGSVSQRGLWDNIRAAAKRNKAAGKPGKKPTAAMLKQERKIKAKGK